MNDYTCACGFEAATAEELGDHVGEMVIPLNDIARDGRAHAEAARDERGTLGPDPAGWRCVCDYVSVSATGLDEHLLARFTESEATGLAGRSHG